MTGTSDKLIDAIDLLKERAEDDDPNALFALVNDLSKVNINCAYIVKLINLVNCLKVGRLLCGINDFSTKFI